MSNNHSPRWTGSRFHPALCITSVLLMKRRARRHSDLSDDFLHVHDCHLLGHANESFQEPPAQPVLPRVQKNGVAKTLESWKWVSLHRTLVYPGPRGFCLLFLYFIFSLSLLQFDCGKRGWRSGVSARGPLMFPGFDSRSGRHICVEFVVSSLLCYERFFPGTPVFPSSQKPTFPNSNYVLECTDISERVLVNRWTHSLVLRE